MQEKQKGRTKGFPYTGEEKSIHQPQFPSQVPIRFNISEQETGLGS
jgi:hypothetical protein